MPKSKHRANRPERKQKPSKNVKREEFHQALIRINGHMILADGRRNTQFRELASIILEMFEAANEKDDQASFVEAKEKLEKFIKGRDESLERLTRATVGGDEELDSGEEENNQEEKEESRRENCEEPGLNEADDLPSDNRAALD